MNVDVFPHLNHVLLKDLPCLNIPCRAINGNLISKGLFDVIVSKKNQLFSFKDFCPKAST